MEPKDLDNRPLAPQQRRHERLSTADVLSTPTPFEDKLHGNAEPGEAAQAGTAAINRLFKDDFSARIDMQELTQLALYREGMALREAGQAPEPELPSLDDMNLHAVRREVTPGELAFVLEYYPHPGDLIADCRQYFPTPQGAIDRKADLMRDLYGQRWEAFNQGAAPSTEAIAQPTPETLRQRILGPDERVTIGAGEHVSEATNDQFKQATGIVNGELKAIINLGSDTKNVQVALVDISNAPRTESGAKRVFDGDYGLASGDLLVTVLGYQGDHEALPFYAIKKNNGSKVPAGMLLGRQSEQFRFLAHQSGISDETLRAVSREHCRVSLDANGDVIVTNLRPSNKTVIESL